jgi:hypothetical protein
MSAFKEIKCKLGDMRKEQEWVLYPPDSTTPHLVIIQCDKRIARVDLNTSKALLSSGKSGHPGFHTLSPQLGAKVCDVDPAIIAKLRELLGKPIDNSGPVIIAGAE